MMALMSAADPNLASTLAAVAQALAEADDLHMVVSQIAQLAVDVIDDADHADMMVLGARGVITVPAATDWVGARVASIEAELDEGPCLYATRNGEVVVMAAIGDDTRWPRFSTRCVAETPARAVLGIPLHVGDTVIGAMDVYSDRAGAFDDEQTAAAVLFAAHASVAFLAARERQHLRDALASRDLIGQAKGILMAQSKITADEAFDLLRRASQRMNTKLTTIAQGIVDRNVGPPDEGATRG